MKVVSVLGDITVDIKQEDLQLINNLIPKFYVESIDGSVLVYEVLSCITLKNCDFNIWETFLLSEKYKILWDFEKLCKLKSSLSYYKEQGFSVAMDDVGFYVIPEGVENSQKLEELIEIGVHYAQGFHWYSPNEHFLQLINCQYKCNTLYLCCTKDLYRYFIIKTFVFSFIPLCQEAYGSTK